MEVKERKTRTKNDPTFLGATKPIPKIRYFPFCIVIADQNIVLVLKTFFAFLVRSFDRIQEDFLNCAAGKVQVPESADTGRIPDFQLEILCAGNMLGGHTSKQECWSSISAAGERKQSVPGCAVCGQDQLTYDTE